MNALVLDNGTLMCRAKRSRLPRGATSAGRGYFASDVIPRDLGLKLWWHPVNALQSLEGLADRESA
jgi:hypothetical protein